MFHEIILFDSFKCFKTLLFKVRFHFSHIYYTRKTTPPIQKAQQEDHDGSLHIVHAVST